MARPRLGEEMNETLRVRCSEKLYADLQRSASISGISLGDFVRHVLQLAVDNDAIVLETFEDQEKRFAAWDQSKTSLLPRKKLTVLFGSQVLTRAENQARMRAAIEKGSESAE